jgi:hypothetical protein
MEPKLSSEYEDLKAKLDADFRKQEARQRILRRKRDERRDIKKGGGGKQIAKAILGGKRMADDTDFNFGANVPDESIDERIAREQAERCMEKIYCGACKRYHGYCAEITEDKEKMKMLPTGDGTQTRSRNNSGGGLAFVNPEDLSTQPQEAKILMVKFTEKGGKSNQPSITLKIAFKGDIRYVWMPARISDPRYKLFLDAFGPDENNWVEERFTMKLKKDDFTEKYQTQYEIVKEQSAGSTAAKKGAHR